MQRWGGGGVEGEGCRGGGVQGLRGAEVQRWRDVRPVTPVRTDLSTCEHRQVVSLSG